MEMPSAKLGWCVHPLGFVDTDSFATDMVVTDQSSPLSRASINAPPFWKKHLVSSDAASRLTEFPASSRGEVAMVRQAMLELESTLLRAAGCDVFQVAEPEDESV